MDLHEATDVIIAFEKRYNSVLGQMQLYEKYLKAIVAQAGGIGVISNEFRATAHDKSLELHLGTGTAELVNRDTGIFR